MKLNTYYFSLFWQYCCPCTWQSRIGGEVGSLQKYKWWEGLFNSINNLLHRYKDAKILFSSCLLGKISLLTTINRLQISWMQFLPSYWANWDTLSLGLGNTPKRLVVLSRKHYNTFKMCGHACTFTLLYLKRKNYILHVLLNIHHIFHGYFPYWSMYITAIEWIVPDWMDIQLTLK